VGLTNITKSDIDYKPPFPKDFLGFLPWIRKKPLLHNSEGIQNSLMTSLDGSFSMKPCQSTQKRGNTRNKMERPTSTKTKEPPKRVNHKGNIKFPDPLPSLEAYQIRKLEDLLKGGLA
jgi:hypothetical protein